MLSWTPGPWIYVFCNDGEPHFSVMGGDQRENGRFPLGADYIENEADARLLACAPEMAEMLERVVAQDPFDLPSVDLVVDAKALLARARGET